MGVRPRTLSLCSASMNDGLRNRARHGRGREGKEGGRTTTAGSTTVAAYPSTRYQLRACFRPKIKDFELFRVRLLPQGAATSCSSVMSPTLISSGHRAARRPLRSPFSLPPRWHCRPVTRFDCHSSPARAPARRPPPVASSARPPPSFLLGISSAAKRAHWLSDGTWVSVVITNLLRQ